MIQTHYLWELRPYFRRTLGQLVLGSLAGIAMNTAVVLPAIFLGRAIDMATAVSRGQASLQDVAWAAVLFAMGTVLTEIPRIGKRYWLITANARIRALLRLDALRGILAWPMAQLHATSVGDLMARINGDVEVLGIGIKECTTETWDTLLFSLSLVVAMMVYDPGLSALVLLPVPAAMLLAHATGRWVARRTTDARKANASLTAALQEHLSALRLLRLVGRREAATARIAALSTHQAATNLAIVRFRNALQPVYGTLVTSGVVLIVWLGGKKVIAGAMTAGAFVAYLELYLRFINRGFRIPQMINSIQSGAAAYQRLRPLLAPPSPIRHDARWSSFRATSLPAEPDPTPTDAMILSGPLAVSLQHVTFRYPTASQAVLTDVSLDIPAGAFVAITGPVGCGKSALVRAMLGLYPLEAGRILLNGKSLDTIPAVERTTRIGYLPEDAQVFSGSVSDNVLMTHGQPADAAAAATVNQALQLSALTRDTQAFPEGVATQVGELGRRVSGGQRQRIALARALAAAHPHRPGLLILDDPFSAVDVDTETQIIDALREAFGPSAPPEHQATIVLISHRLAAFPHADMLAILHGGRIVEQGTHAELLQAAGLYHRIFHAQEHTRRSTEHTYSCLAGPLAGRVHVDGYDKGPTK